MSTHAQDMAAFNEAKAFLFGPDLSSLETWIRAVNRVSPVYLTIDIVQRYANIQLYSQERDGAERYEALKMVNDKHYAVAVAVIGTAINEYATFHPSRKINKKKALKQRRRHEADNQS